MSNVEVARARIVSSSCTVVQIHRDVDLEFAMPIWKNIDYMLARNSARSSNRSNFVVDLLYVVTSSSSSTSENNEIGVQDCVHNIAISIRCLKGETIVRICRSSSDSREDKSSSRTRENSNIDNSSTSGTTCVTFENVICSLVHQEHSYRSCTAHRGRSSIAGNSKVVRRVYS